MIAQNGAYKRMFQRPGHFMTLADQTVAAQLTQRLGGEVYETAKEMRVAVEGGISPDSIVVLWDRPGGRCIHQTTSLRAGEAFPDWSCGALWGIQVFPGAAKRLDGMVRQIKADFERNFDERLDNGRYPWGNPRLGETVRRTSVNIGGAKVADVLTKLNSGPNLAAAIADQACAAELPTGSQISWYRVTPDPLDCDEVPRLRAIMSAFTGFERACQALLNGQVKVQGEVLAGVRIDPSLVECYLHPRVDHFSVRRPDLHIAHNSVFASESDEMPGGMPELWHMDRCYGVNQPAWHAALTNLLDWGPLVFLVSDDWSQCYHAETLWLCDQLRAEGHDVTFLTTSPKDLARLTICDTAVLLDDREVGTIWRQFPIWEAVGVVAQLVLAAHRGAVRMVPEFAHFGNKAWFAIYHQYRGYFSGMLTDDALRILDEVLPQSYLVRPGAASFPIGVNGSTIHDLAALLELPEATRDGLVLKLVGANPLTARSYGVLMGHGIPQTQWEQWIRERYQESEPFIVQHRLPTDVVDLAVINTRHRTGELFPSRVLMRPWEICGVLVSAHICAVPTNTLRVHGRTDMCATSLDLG